MSTPVSSSTSSTTPSTTTGSTGSSSSASPTTSGLNSSSAPPFQISGIVSGLDTTSIINKLIQIYSMPMTQLQQDESTISTKQAAWNDIQSKINALQTAIQTLQAPTAAAGRVAAVSPPAGSTSTTAAVSATVTPTAALGTLSVNVKSLATTGSLTSGSGISAPITTTSANTTPLVGENFGTTPTLGTFTINGTQITVDSGTTMLGAGADTLQTKLAAAGVTLSTTVSGSNITAVTISSASAIQLGSPNDTSNILTALHLTNAVPNSSDTSITSNGSLSGVPLSTALSSAAFGTSVSAGTMNVNGVAISYTTADTLGSIIGKINQSAAGVTASYDTTSDKMVLTANQTGGGAIAVSDSGGGNLSQVLNLNTGVSVTGNPAQFTVSGYNNNAIIASATNTVSNLIPGVTLKLNAPSASMGASDASTVTITSDTTTLTNDLQSFVTAYNSVQDTIAKYSAITLDQTGSPSGGVLAGDPTLNDLASQIDQIVNSTPVNVAGKQYSMSDLGISTGTPGSFVAGQTPTLDLTFNSSQVATTLASTPTLAQSFLGNGTLSSQNGTLFQTLNNALNNFTQPLGVIGTAQDALSAQYTNDDQQIQNWQLLIQQQQSYYTQMFTGMETSLAMLQAQGSALAASMGTSTTSSSSGSSSSSGTATTGG